MRWQVQWSNADGTRRVRIFEDGREAGHFAANLRDLIDREVIRSPITDINPVQENPVAQKIQDIQADAENQAAIDDMNETKAAARKANTQTMPGAEVSGFKVDPDEDERTVEEIPGLLEQIQQPHKDDQGNVTTALFTTAYGQKVRAAV